MAARLSGRDRALAHLRNVVLSDPAREGTFVNEQAVAAEVGVSRTPVREALLIVSSEGLVVMVPHRGAFVPPLSARQIHELMDLRGLVERHAADLVLDEAAGAERTVVAMETILAEQQAQAGAVDRSDATRFIRSDRAFHQAMVDGARHELLARTYDTLRERQIRVGIRALEVGGERWGSVCAEHGAICAALRSGERQAARDAIDSHLQATLHTLLAV